MFRAESRLTKEDPMWGLSGHSTVGFERSEERAGLPPASVESRALRLL